MICRWLKYSLLDVLLFSAVPALAVAQGKVNQLTTDQLLERLRSIKHYTLQTEASHESAQNIKCGFGIQAEVVNRWKEFSRVQRVELSELLKADVLQADTIAGHFHIFYDTTGTNEPALLDNNSQRIPGTAKAYIRLVAEIFNHVWDVEIDQMGYSAPPFEGGQAYYNIFVKDIRDYGETYFDETTRMNAEQNPPLYRSYIVIDNDYQEIQYYTHGVNALKVTAAHEFHHAIQIGSYGFWANDTYAHELTSTWFEDVVYTEMNDYYQYLTDFFGNQNRTSGFWQGLSFNSHTFDGYERCIFAHFLAKRFNMEIMKEIWTGMRTLPFNESYDAFLEGSDAALINHGSNLQSAFTEFTNWTYHTADRADTVKYFPEGNQYPRFQALQKLAFYNTTSATSGDVEPLSSSMYEFDMQKDTITVIIANVNIGSALTRTTGTQNIGVTLSSQALSPPYQEFANGLKVKITVDDLSLWRPFIMQDSAQIPRLHMDAAPNPYRLAQAPSLKLPINQDGAKTAEVFFFTSSFQLVYSGFLNIGDEDGFRAIVVPTSEVRSKLSSGIYFILAKTATSDYKWKVAVIR